MIAYNHADLAGVHPIFTYGSYADVTRVATIGNVDERNVRLGNNVRRFREDRGWNKADLARKAGISPAYVTRLERAEYGRPSLEKVKAIAAALGVPVTDLSEPLQDLAPGLAASLHQLFGRPEDATLLADVLTDLSRHEHADQQQVLTTLEALVRTIPRRN